MPFEVAVSFVAPGARGCKVEEKYGVLIAQGSKDWEIHHSNNTEMGLFIVAKGYIDKDHVGYNFVRCYVPVLDSHVITMEEWRDPSTFLRHRMSGSDIDLFLAGRENPFTPHAWVLGKLVLFSEPMFHLYEKHTQTQFRIKHLYKFVPRPRQLIK